MLRLGEIAGKVAQRPYIPMLQEDNARKGFFEAPEFWAVLAELPDARKPVPEVAYVTGWRIRSELLTRQWMHVDFDAGWIRLEPGETKNREGRMFPMTPTLRAMLECQRAHTRAIERATGQVIPWVFHRDGRPIKHFRRAWLTACKVGKAPQRIPHDFRARPSGTWSALACRGRPAMKMVGHKTEAIYRRSAIAVTGPPRVKGRRLRWCLSLTQRPRRPRRVDRPEGRLLRPGRTAGRGSRGASLRSRVGDRFLCLGG
jgi:integrase